VYTDVAMTRVDGVSMTCIQLSVVAFLSLVFAVASSDTSQINISTFIKFFPWLLFLAVVEGLGCTLMALGQVYSPPAHVTLLLGLEGVFTSFFSFIFLGEVLSAREFMGCLLMLASTVMVKVGCGMYEKPLGNLCGCCDLLCCLSAVTVAEVKSLHTNGHGHSSATSSSVSVSIISSIAEIAGKDRDYFLHPSGKDSAEDLEAQSTPLISKT